MIGVTNRRILIGNYDQKVEAFTTTKGSFTDGASDINTSIFTCLSSVEILSGSKALQYNEQGINNPVIIEMNWIDTLPSYLMWDGKKITIVSFVDPDNHYKRRVRILGSYTV
jgi:hypothetical protein